MKKLLGIVVLGLLLSSCSDLKVKKALENCANKKFLSSLNRDNSIYISHADNKTYLKLFRDLNVSLHKKENLELRRKNAKEKYEKENPAPEFSKEELEKFAGTFSPGAAREAQQAYYKKELEYSNQLTQKLSLWFDNLKAHLRPLDLEISGMAKTISLIKYQRKQIRLNAVDSKFKKMSFKEKSKISQYVNLYGACETEYKELPNKFLMKYQK